MLNELTKRVLETALEEEMSARLGYDKHAPEGRNRGNSRNETVDADRDRPGAYRSPPRHRRQEPAGDSVRSGLQLPMDDADGEADWGCD